MKWEVRGVTITPYDDDGYAMHDLEETLLCSCGYLVSDAKFSARHRVTGKCQPPDEYDAKHMACVLFCPDNCSFK